MTEHAGLSDLEIVSDEHGNAIIMKSCKSAVRAQKKREKTERIKKCDAQWALEESIGEPIPQSTLDDYKTDFQKQLDDESESADQRIYGRAPSPTENPFLKKELFLMCLRCPMAAVVEYQSGLELGNKIGHSLTGRVQLGVTVCRLCFRKDGDTGNAEHDLARMMGVLNISPSYVESSKLYKHISSDRMEGPAIVTAYEGIAYISMKSINDNIDDSCVLKSMMDCGDAYIPSHLKGGFF
jgi:hypothetical protein